MKSEIPVLTIPMNDTTEETDQKVMDFFLSIYGSGRLVGINLKEPFRPHLMRYKFIPDDIPTTESPPKGTLLSGRARNALTEHLKRWCKADILPGVSDYRLLQVASSAGVLRSDVLSRVDKMGRVTVAEIMAAASSANLVEHVVLG